MRKGDVIALIVVLIVIIGAIFRIWYLYRPPTPPKPPVEKELEKFVIALDKDIDGIYPKTKAEVVSESVNWEIFSSLGKYTREGKFIPDLAESWYNPDDLTWEIVLKKGVKFHNGKEMTSEDVRFSFAEVPKQIEEFYHRESVAMVERVEAIDRYKIKVVTKKPYPLLIKDLSALAILSKDYIEKEGYDASPIGTGPYKFIKWEKGEEIVLERFEAYYGKKPIAKKVVYKIIPEEEKRIDALIKKEVDFVIQLTLDGAERVEKAAEVKPAITPSIGITFLGMDNREKTPGIKLERNPLSDVRVRKAIAYGIDKRVIIDEVFKGRAKIATQISVPESFGYNPDLKAYPFDPEKARKLLAEAGYPEGFEVEFLSPDDERAKVCETISRQLSGIGIKAKVNVLPRGEFFGKLFAYEASFFPLTILDTSLDTAGLASGIYHTQTEEYGSLNLIHYSNPKVDELIVKAMTTLDSKARMEGAKEIMRITIEEDLPYIPLYITEFLGGVREDLDFSQRPDGSIDLEDLSFAK